MMKAWPPWFWDRSQKTQASRQFLHIVLFACLMVGIDKGDVFAAEVLHAVIHHTYQGGLPKVLPIAA